MLFFWGNHRQSPPTALLRPSPCSRGSAGLEPLPPSLPVFCQSPCLHFLLSQWDSWPVKAATLRPRAPSPYPCGCWAVNNQFWDVTATVRKLCELVKSLVLWNRPLQENSYYENWQELPIRDFPFPRPSHSPQTWAVRAPLPPPHCPSFASDRQPSALGQRNCLLPSCMHVGCYF